MTLQLVEKFGADAMKWVVEAVFDDLVDWSDWFVRKRLLPPLRLVALGTYNDQSRQSGNMQDARYESGLDNSPMYDGEVRSPTPVASGSHAMSSVVLHAIPHVANRCLRCVAPPVTCEAPAPLFVCVRCSSTTPPTGAP